MSEQTPAYYAMVSEIEGLELTGFPKKFPMFFLVTDSELNTYNALMIKAVARGFSTSLRKLCFTLGCKEGFSHEDIYNLSKELPEVDEEHYTFLKNIVHWNPILEASKVLQRFIDLADAQQAKIQEPEMQEMIKTAFDDVASECDVGLTPRKK